MKITKYIWYIPALYVAYMFGEKITEGFAHSQEFIDIISVITPLKPIAYYLTPLVGLLDFSIGLSLLLNPFVTKNNKIQTFLFAWATVWPFVPSSLRYFGGVAAFEITEVLSISIAAIIAYILWATFTRDAK
jgi:hypothetical protein